MEVRSSVGWILHVVISGGATPGHAMSNDLAGRSIALAQAVALPCLALCIAMFR